MSDELVKDFIRRAQAAYQETLFPPEDWLIVNEGHGSFMVPRKLTLEAWVKKNSELADVEDDEKRDELSRTFCERLRTQGWSEEQIHGKGETNNVL